MRIKLVDEKEYEIKEFNTSPLIGGEEGEVITTVHLLSDMPNEEFFSTIEQDFTEDNCSEITIFGDGLNMSFKPKGILSRNFSSNSNGTQTTVVFKN